MDGIQSWEKVFVFWNLFWGLIFVLVFSAATTSQNTEDKRIKFYKPFEKWKINQKALMVSKVIHLLWPHLSSKFGLFKEISCLEFISWQWFFLRRPASKRLTSMYLLLRQRNLAKKYLSESSTLCIWQCKTSMAERCFFFCSNQERVEDIYWSIQKFQKTVTSRITNFFFIATNFEVPSKFLEQKMASMIIATLLLEKSI